MSRVKKQEPAARMYTKAKWQGFVNVYLSREEKTAIKDQAWDSADYTDFIKDACEHHYKFSLSFSEAGGFWSASLTGQYKELPNGGVCMSLKHRDFDTAIRALAWCLKEAGYKEDWSERYTTADGNDW